MKRRKRRRTDYRRLCIVAVLVLMVTVLSAGATDAKRIVTDARDKEEDKESSISTGFHEIKIVGRDDEKDKLPSEYINFDLAHLSIVGRDEDGNDGRVRAGDAEERTDVITGDHQDGAGSDLDTDTDEDEAGLDESGVTEYSGDPSADSEYAGEASEGRDDAGGDWDTELSDSDMGSDDAGYEGSVDESYDEEDGYDDSGLIDEQPDGDSGVDEQGWTDTEQWGDGGFESAEYSGNDGSEDNPSGSTAGELGTADLTYLGNWTATAYCACPICTGAYSSGYTASGTLATEGRTIACNSLPFGTQVYIEGYGYYIVEDTGWSPYGDAWLDIFFDTHDSALAFGLRNVDVYVVN